MKEALLSIIKDENRIITGQIDPQYLSDNLGRKKGTAEAVVFPVSTEEISGVMRYAWKNNLPVTPRGAGTNLVGSTVPSGHGIVLDVSLMNHVLELDEETFTATLSTGSGRKESHHRRKYQHQCRRYASCEIRCNARLCHGVGTGSGRRHRCHGGQQEP